MGNIRMLAMDLDGTLTNSRKEITARTLAALDAAAAKGVTLVAASGRPPVGIRPVAETLKLAERGGCILAYNGAEVVDCRTGNVLYQKEFPAEMIAPVCRLAEDFDVGILSYDKAGVIATRPDDPWVLREGKINRIPTRGVKDLPAYLREHPIEKLLMALAPTDMEALENEARRRFAGKIDVVRSCPFFLEAVSLGVSKGVALAALAEQRGIGREEIMAVGDAMNDLPMIQYAGVGVCMANGDPEVKALSDYVTTADNDHDGVAEAIEKYILK